MVGCCLVQPGLYLGAPIPWYEDDGVEGARVGVRITGLLKNVLNILCDSGITGENQVTEKKIKTNKDSICNLVIIVTKSESHRLDGDI